MSAPAAHLTPRQKARELAFQFLYRYDGQQDPLIERTEIEEDFSRHLSHSEPMNSRPNSPSV